jgi:hypothetical protein
MSTLENIYAPIAALPRSSPAMTTNGEALLPMIILAPTR